MAVFAFKLPELNPIFNFQGVQKPTTETIQEEYVYLLHIDYSENKQ
jgi:hypothetical protein